MKIFKIFFIAIFILNFADAQNTQGKIKEQEEKLKSQDNEEKQISQKLQEIAKEILKTQDEIKNTNKQISDFKSEILALENKVKAENLSLKELNAKKDKYTKQSHKIEESVSKLIMEDFLFSLVSQDTNATNSKAFISKEILSVLSDSSQFQLENATKGYEEILKNIKEKNAQILKLQSDISLIASKKSQLEVYNNQQNSLLKKIQSDNNDYISRLSNIKKSQEQIRKTLGDLKVIKEVEDKERIKQLAKEKELAAQKQARLDELKKKEESKKLQSKEKIEVAKLKNDIKESNDKVRIIGSSYQNSRVKKYVGIKTIAPLKAYNIKQRFGNYVDPVYGIKIFNETVTLSSKGNDSPVYSVFDGKVVFAKDVNMLHKVVIIEHKDQLHTIYANLSQIPSSVKVGSIIKKESIIGRVKKDLIFEVTQKNFHINPLEIIK